jgi:hypothetical protein
LENHSDVELNPAAFPETPSPNNQKSIYPPNKATINNQQSASSRAVGDSRRTLNREENLFRSETPIDSTHNTESLQTILENSTSMLVIPDSTDALISTEKPKTENITRLPKSVPIIKNELTAKAVPETKHRDSGEIVFTSNIPEDDLAFKGISSGQDYAGSSKTEFSSPADAQSTELATGMDGKVSDGSADATKDSMEDPDEEERSQIRKEMAVLIDALAASSLFLSFSVVILVALYLCLLQLLEIESRI